jgi:hypothetical protein
LAQSNEIERHVNRVYGILHSSADAKPLFAETPMNLALVSLEKSLCVKISRIMREIHASPQKLFTPNF